VTLPLELLPFVEDPAYAALLLDFDGSIAPIVDDPSSARPLPAMVRVLRELVPRLRTVAVVSGRTVDFLDAVLPLEDVVLAGLYGLERRIAGTVIVDPRAERWVQPIAAAASDAAAALDGLPVERKGRLCVTIHYRTAPERGAEVRAVAAQVAREHGLEAPQRARMAVELRPPVDVDKGTVVRELAAGAHAAAFAGDDTGDVPAFAALADLARAGAIAHAVTIGLRSPEAPAEILAADVVVDGPAALAAMLGELVDALSRRG
jgi:trehalose 6-phosphate phosphatase